MTKQTQAEQQLAEARSILLASIEETRKKFTRVEGAQAYCFRAIALDYDGTLTESGRPDNNLLNALQELRREGRQLLLVTGRTMADLRREFADVGEWFDLMVTALAAGMHPTLTLHERRVSAKLVAH